MASRWTDSVLLALGALALGQTAPAQSTCEPSRAAADFSQARQLIRAGMGSDSLLGVAIAVVCGDSILWAEGFGWANRERQVPATAHTPFYLASVTKTITATAVMVLRQRGQLDLDRPANEYLGGPRLTSPAWDPNGATLRGLATHTSGLTTFDLDCATSQPRCRLPSTREIIERYGVIVAPPSQQFDYSNLGYLLLGEAVAHASKRDLGAFLKDEVFIPLGMRESSLGVSAALAPQTAVRYSWTRGALEPSTFLSGGSSAYASAWDLALFGMMHMKVHRAAARQVISDALIDTMQLSVVSAGRNQTYGIGWWVEADRYGYRSLLAQGGTDAAQAWLRLIPAARVAVVVLANKGVGFPSDVVDSAIGALLPTYAQAWTAQRLAASQSASAQTTVVRLDSAFTGAWLGRIRAEGRDVPVDIVVVDSVNARGTVGQVSRTGSARPLGARLRLALPGDLETADSTGGRGMRFYLTLRGAALSGYVTTRPTVTSGLDGQVSYWVELRRRDP